MISLKESHAALLLAAKDALEALKRFPTVEGEVAALEKAIIRAEKVERDLPLLS